MSKKIFTYTIALLCATYFLVAGTGYNVAQYCCASCSQEGIEAVMTKSCAAIHHAHAHENTACCSHTTPSEHTDGACCSASGQTDGCQLWRLQTDIPSVDIKQFQFDDVELTLALPLAILSSLYEIKASETSVPICSLHPDPPRTGRDILTYHSILRI